jgi:Cys/Met metabolism PLP-dependent enzyme
MTADTAHFDTRCIHAGQEPDATSGAVMTPIVLATTFAQDGPGQHRGYDYSRAGNPTCSVLEVWQWLRCNDGRSDDPPRGRSRGCERRRVRGHVPDL